MTGLLNKLHRLLPPTADKDAVTKALTGFCHQKLFINEEFTLVKSFCFLILFLVGIYLFCASGSTDIGSFSVGVFKTIVAKGVHNISFGDLLGNLGTTM